MRFLLLCLVREQHLLTNQICTVPKGALRARPSYFLGMHAQVSRTAEWRHISDADLATARDRFIGDTTQLPPMYSAIRIKGELQSL